MPDDASTAKPPISAAALDTGSTRDPDEPIGRDAVETKAAAAPHGDDGPGTGGSHAGGRGEDGRHPADRSARERDAPDRSRNVLGEETRAESGRAGAAADQARLAPDAADGDAPRSMAGLQPGERRGPAEPPAAAPPAPPPATAAPNPAGDGITTIATAAGGLRPVVDAGAGTPTAGYAPSAGHGSAGPPHPASQMVSVTLSRMADGRADRMTIQLRPAELGAVEVKLDFRKDGTVQAMIVADRAETLGLLQRDAPTLEKALQDAGLRTDSGGLSFSLRDGGDGERNFEGFRQAFGKPRNRGPAQAEDGARTATLVAGSGPAGDPGRVDIRI